jgi:hypothetical protein
MTLLSSFAQWLGGREWALDFAASWLYPIVLATHLICIPLFGGMIFMTNLRLLGWSMRSYSISEVVTRLRIWKRIGFVIMIACGLLLAGSEFDKYYDNPYFWTKMTLLSLIGVHGLIFRRGVYQNTAALDQASVLPRQAKLAASLSLVLWIGVVSAGRMIGYYEDPNELGAARGSAAGNPAITRQR